MACASQGLQDCAPQEGASQGPEDGPDSLPQETEDGPGSVPQGPEDAPDLALQSSHRLQECQAAAAQLTATVEEARVEMSGAVAQHDSMVDESAGDGPESAADANTGVLLHSLSQAASADACPGTQMPTADESSSKHASVEADPAAARPSIRKSAQVDSPTALSSARLSAEADSTAASSGMRTHAAGDTSAAGPSSQTPAHSTAATVTGDGTNVGDSGSPRGVTNTVQDWEQGATVRSGGTAGAATSGDSHAVIAQTGTESKQAATSLEQVRFFFTAYAYTCSPPHCV